MHAGKEQMEAVERLKKRSDFLRVQSRGEKWVAKGLVFQVAPNEKGIRRFGVTVSKRVSTSAVKRNRIKRRLRAVAYDILPLYARSGADYVLIGRAETAQRIYSRLQDDLKWCLKKTGYGVK